MPRRHATTRTLRIEPAPIWLRERHTIALCHARHALAVPQVVSIARLVTRRDWAVQVFRFVAFVKPAEIRPRTFLYDRHRLCDHRHGGRCHTLRIMPVWWVNRREEGRAAWTAVPDLTPIVGCLFGALTPARCGHGGRHAECVASPCMQKEASL
jgi:hypothetical protein